MTAWTETEVAELRRLWDIHGGRLRKIALLMNRTKGSISSMSRRAALQFRSGRAVVLAPDAPAVTEARTRFQRRVVDPTHNVLKSGGNQRKLGAVIMKGKWKGFPVFSLSLEERKTCPATCIMWRGCYGNNMNYAKRYRHGLELEEQVWRELWRLQHRYPAGFVVRLHILGDFYSTSYVDLWEAALDLFPALRVFGYSAWTWDTPIGDAVAKLRNSQWDRFAVRTSGAKRGLRTEVFHAKPSPSVIPCPAQQGKTASCSTCALCWQSKRPIGFHAH